MQEENRYLYKQKEEVFNILGLKLRFDDILLVCLIIFLYNEGVQDQFLFIALILLLLTWKMDKNPSFFHMFCRVCIIYNEQGGTKCHIIL